MRENKFEEALEMYKKIGKLEVCREMLEEFIKINLDTGNFLLVAKFSYEKYKLEDQL
jgi:hypothetical protein